MKTPTHNQKVRGLQIAVHLIALVGLYFATVDYLLLSLFVYWTIGVLGINIGFHRLISHRSFETWRPVEYILALIGSITSIGSPLAWVALHRQHHRFAETENDPHSPYQIGWFKAWFGLWNVKRIDPKMIPDLRHDKIHLWMHKNYLTINVIYVAILMAIDPYLLFFGYALPAVLVFHSTSTITVLAHIHGYKTYECRDESRNSWICSLATLGEGWHNNHHANPKDWNNQHQWWEFDLPAYIIRLIKK